METMRTQAATSLSSVRARRAPRLRQATAFALCLLVWLAPWTVSCAASAADAKVLILNSNGAVKKYAAIESAFQSNLAVPTARLDMAGGRGSPDTLKENLKNSGATLVYAIGSNAYQLASQNAKQPAISNTAASAKRPRFLTRRTAPI